jgi:peptidoglycan/xylan/chitin deacetylase (PgdA/CDA1 family)
MAIFKGKRELMARALGGSFLRPVARALGGPSLIGLTYHRICDFDTLDDGVISASIDEFDWQLTFLKDNIRVLSGEEVGKVARGEQVLREPALVITFDDGYADNLDAGRTLARHGLPAIFFLTTSFINTDTITLWDRIAFAVKRTEQPRLKIPAVGTEEPHSVEVTPRDLAIRQLLAVYAGLPRNLQEPFTEAVEQAAGASVSGSARERPLFMRWDDVRQLHALGHTIGAHTHSHPILSQISLEQQEQELRLCNDAIARELGTTPTLLAYPNGKQWTFSQQTKDVARRMGYSAAFSFYGGHNEPDSFDAYDLRRVWVSPTESRDLFRARITFPQLLA